MSTFKSNKFWNKKPQSRESSASQEGGGGRVDPGRGGRGSAETVTPFLNEISAMSIERYLEAVHQYSLTHHATIAPWIRGRIPLVMLEHELPRAQENLLGRMAKHHTLVDGSASAVSLTAAEVRTKLIEEVMAENIKRRSTVKDTEREIGVSSMESESTSSGGRKDDGVGLAKIKRRSTVKDTEREIGVSSMESESTSSGGRKDDGVGRAKDSRTKIGGSSMDAGQSPGGSEAEPDVQSLENESRELREEAVRDLFPHNAKKSREVERSNLWKEAATLLGKMFYYWPSRDIQTKMQSSESLSDAFEQNDVIRFIEELRVFSLSGSGNPESNREAAEKHLMSLRMKPGKALEYFKDFTEAVEHVRVCKSSFSDFKIVDLFLRNIDQTSFPEWYVKFLSEDEPMYRFQKLKFEEVKEHALRYHNTVIRVNERSAPQGRGTEGKGNVIRSMNHLKSSVAETGTKNAPLIVDPVVLATLIKQAGVGKKRKAEKIKDEIKDDPTDKKKKIVEEKKGICFKFRDTGKCDRGNSCHFAHTK